MSREPKALNQLECGDIIKLSLSPTKGHEQDGYRPAVVLTNPKEQKILGGMVGIAPITRTKKGFPLHVDLDSRTKTQGSILIEHHRMVDLNSRTFKYIEPLHMEQLRECKTIYEALYEKLQKL